MGCARVCGLPKTIRIIDWLAKALPARRGLLDRYSERIDLLLDRFPYVLIGRKQRCLIRGFYLYFFGKRLHQDVCLRVGNKLEDGTPKVHCWILQEGMVRFEDQETIEPYVVLVDYA